MSIGNINYKTMEYCIVSARQNQLYEIDEINYTIILIILNEKFKLKELNGGFQKEVLESLLTHCFSIWSLKGNQGNILTNISG